MATKGIGLREWSLAATDFDTEADFRQAVVNELASFEHIGERLGVGLTALPARRKQDGQWVTLGWVFRPVTVPAIPEGESTPGETPEERLHRELHDGTRGALEPEEPEAALIEDPVAVAE